MFILFQCLTWNTSVVIINHILKNIYENIEMYTFFFTIEVQTVSESQMIFSKKKHTHTLKLLYSLN